LGEIDTWIRSENGMQTEKFKALDTFFQKYASVPVTEMIVEGQPWGALEEMLLGQPLAPGLTFTLPKDNTTITYWEMQPWLELLTTGAFSAHTLNNLPISYQTTDRWMQLLQKSIDQQGMTWLHALHMGVMLTERGNIEEPRALFAKSMALKANPLAARNLAVLCTSQEDAWAFYQQAWSILHSDFTHDTQAYHRLTLNLITEISFFLQQNAWYDRMQWFIHEVVSNKYLKEVEIDAFVTMVIKDQLYQGKYEDALKELGSHCFPTYAKARSDLMAMWNQAVEGKAAQEAGHKLTALERHRARMASPIPDNIGCQYASEYCLNYW